MWKNLNFVSKSRVWWVSYLLYILFFKYFIIYLSNPKYICTIQKKTSQNGVWNNFDVNSLVPNLKNWDNNFKLEIAMERMGGDCFIHFLSAFAWTLKTSTSINVSYIYNCYTWSHLTLLLIFKFNIIKNIYKDGLGFPDLCWKHPLFSVHDNYSN